MTALPAASSDLIDEFVVPQELEASAPAEARGLARDQVRLMVAHARGQEHRRFVELSSILEAGDLLVVNNSATLPASVVVDGARVIHFSNRQPGGFVVVEPRRLAGASSKPEHDVRPGEIVLPGGALLRLVAPFPAGSSSRRLWLASFESTQPLDDYLEAWGRPIRYGHVDRAWPLAAYQTIFATVPGSAEMPSAGRPFSPGLVAALARAGVGISSITLHTGVSSQESGEPPYPEWVEVVDETALRVNEAKRGGGRVIAVGTTVVRALAAAADERGWVRPLRAWTDLVVGPGDDLESIDGLITGWHEPESTHLDMLESIGGREALVAAYGQALRRGYLWHEFGDSLLLLRR